MKIGIEEGFVPAELLTSLSASHKMGACNAMQWTDGMNAGFSDQIPWLGGRFRKLKSIEFIGI